MISTTDSLARRSIQIVLDVFMAMVDRPIGQRSYASIVFGKLRDKRVLHIDRGGEIGPHERLEELLASAMNGAFHDGRIPATSEISKGGRSDGAQPSDSPGLCGAFAAV